jgi:hypothetical protein
MDAITLRNIIFIIGAIIMAIEQGLRSAPEFRARLPRFIASERWNFAPLILMIVAGLIWVVRSWEGPKQTELVSVKHGQQSAVAALLVPAHSWPALTKDEIRSWTDTLRGYHVAKVGIPFVDYNQEDLVISAGTAFRQAGWGEPSIQPSNFSIGLQIRAGKDVADAGRALQGLCEQKFAITVPFDETAPPGSIIFYVGWRP